MADKPWYGAQKRWFATQLWSYSNVEAYHDWDMWEKNRTPEREHFRRVGALCEGGKYYIFKRKGSRDAFVALTDSLYPGCFAALDVLPEGLKTRDIDTRYDDDKPEDFKKP